MFDASTGAFVAVSGSGNVASVTHVASATIQSATVTVRTGALVRVDVNGVNCSAVGFFFQLVSTNAGVKVTVVVADSGSVLNVTSSAGPYAHGFRFTGNSSEPLPMTGSNNVSLRLDAGAIVSVASGRGQARGLYLDGALSSLCAVILLVFVSVSVSGRPFPSSTVSLEGESSQPPLEPRRRTNWRKLIPSAQNT